MDCGECNVCLHGECYACMVGVATGPESHDTCCGARNRMFTDDGRILVGNPTTHRIHTRYEGERAFWECSCGTAGNCADYKLDDASDRHIDYDAGERRIDTTRAL
jgi:hypothetical protein